MERNLARKTLAIIAFALLLAALTPGAQAEIVYTPVNVVVQNNTYNLDLNNDGITDFTISGVNKDGFCTVPPYYQKYPHDTATIKVLPASGNGVEGGSRAAALDAAAVIGPGQTFYFTGSLMEHVKIGRYLFDYCISRDMYPKLRALRCRKWPLVRLHEIPRLGISDQR
jgi:hypothetical protein